MKVIFTGILAVICVAVSGCASAKYKAVPKGKMGGVVTIEWIGTDKFIYRPDPQRPFYFQRANGEVIQPKAIYTDGGSIPKPLWSIRGYSAWGFGPAYLAHDWLFDAHYCHLPEAENHTALTAADVLAECMKTLMEENPNVLKSSTLLYTIDGAVRSPIARNLWATGKCTPPPPASSPSGRAMSRTARKAGWVQSFDLDAMAR